MHFFRLELVAFALAALQAAGVKVYAGDDGQKVTLVRLAGAQKPPEALVKISGTDSPLDGKILRVELREWDGNEDWATYELGTGRYVLLTKRAGRYELYPPKAHDSVALKFDQKSTDAANADEILAEYQKAHPPPGQ